MIKPPITGDAPAPFDRYVTENQYAKESGISRQSLKIARTMLTEMEDWEHVKGGPIWWSRLGVDRLIRGMALSSGGISASAFAKATLAQPPSRDPQGSTPATLDPKATIVANLATLPPRGEVSDLDPVFGVPPGSLILGGSFTSKSENLEEPEPAQIVPRGTLPVVWAIVHRKVANPGLILVLVEGAKELVKVRVRPDSQWMIGDRIQVRDIGRDVWEYAGRAPRYRGEFGGTGRVV
jgi:hypothetical protein